MPAIPHVVEIGLRTAIEIAAEPLLGQHDGKRTVERLEVPAKVERDNGAFCHTLERIARDVEIGHRLRLQ